MDSSTQQPRLLHGKTALQNSSPYACMPNWEMEVGTAFMIVIGMTRAGSILMTYPMRDRHANPFRHSGESKNRTITLLGVICTADYSMSIYQCLANIRLV